MFTVTVIVIITSIQTACANPCIDFSCNCQGTEVICNQKNLVDIPDGIPNTTTILFLSFNQISSLTANVFNDLGLLETLDLSKNQISEITADTFKDLVSLATLDLRYNQISIIAADTFKDIVSLVILDLSNNQISIIAADTFSDLVSLDYMDLSNNQISIIAADTFKDLVSLVTLDLSNNQISIIAADTFKDLVSLVTLSLFSNKISTLAPDTFKDLVSLESLFLNNNVLTTISANIFRTMTNISLLNMDINTLICCNMTDLIKWKASQTELNEVLGTCFDFNAITEINNFNISNCTIPVDGQWGSWSTKSCSVTCGSGTEYRYRICNNPSPSDGGKYCVGNDTELSQCNLGDCPESCKKHKQKFR
ncbi:unnamed protein product [Mytilus coruscus]|uniref:LRRNT domain-containing protein n=1 Tax=Mytilus coruscus TaxID=42192 RepID=A0A6J8EKT7_MYTCO|nr:unnamed protein product [Mytilus coruscus]